MDGANPLYRKITSIDPASQTIRWNDTLQLNATIPTAAQVTSAEFRLIVYYQATPPTGAFTVVEEWPNLSMEADSADYVVNAIDQQFTGSR